VSQVADEIHTNTIENLWNHVKKDLKKTKMTTKYMFSIAKFYFRKNLSSQDQLNLLIRGLHNNIQCCKKVTRHFFLL